MLSFSAPNHTKNKSEKSNDAGLKIPHDRLLILLHTARRGLCSDSRETDGDDQFHDHALNRSEAGLLYSFEAT